MRARVRPRGASPKSRSKLRLCSGYAGAPEAALGAKAVVGDIVAKHIPVLYTNALSPDCVRVRREFKRLGVEVETRDVLVSRRNRGELSRLLDGQTRIPCLVLADELIAETEEIMRFLRLRYGKPLGNEQRS